MLPALSKARERARTTQCASNLRSIGQLLILYADDNKGFLPAINGSGGSDNYSFASLIRITILKQHYNFRNDTRDILFCPSLEMPAAERYLTNYGTTHIWYGAAGDFGSWSKNGTIGNRLGRMLKNGVLVVADLYFFLCAVDGKFDVFGHGVIGPAAQFSDQFH